MSSALPSTGMIIAFCAVYEAGSFAKAAERLHMTPPAISYQIRILEELIGQPLFQRSPTGISSTPIAHDLYPDARSILQLAKGIMHRSALQSQEGPIRILATQAFASLWLTPRIPKLLSRFSDKRFEIVGWIGGAVDHESEDLSSTTDIEIRYATPDSLPLDKDSHLIAQDSAIPVCAPQYFEKIKPEIGSSLPEGVTIIHALNWPGTWERWCQAAFGAAVKASDELHFQSTALCVQAALSGVGIAMAHAPLVADEIRAGHLMPAHSFRLTVKDGYFAILSPKHRGRTSFFDAFVDWCRAEMSDAQELT